MAKHMKLWVLGALILVVAGTALASNMGFKLVPNISAGGQNFTLSLPINNNYTNAQSLFNDLSASCAGAFGAGSKVERIVPSVGGKTRQTWSVSGGNNFAISKTEGYIVQTSTGQVCTTAVIVGSHDPALAYQFSTSGVNYLVSIPYHTTAQNARDLYLSIGDAGAGSKIERIVPSVGGKTRQTWSNSGGTNFPVTIGEAYIVQVSAPRNWSPAHY